MRSLLVLGAAATIAAAIVAPGHGGGPALVTAALVVGLGAPALAVARVLGERRRLGSLRRQFGFATAVAVGLILVLVLATARLMFVSSHDALVISAIVLAAGIVAMHAAGLVAGPAARELETVGSALRAVGHGERELHLGGSAPDEIGALARSADAMAEQLAAGERARDAAEAARRELVAAVSHDLRTPIASLRLLVEAVDDEIGDEATRQRYLRTMQTHIRSLSAMIDDLFELSRIEAGDIDWSIREVQLAVLVDEAVDAMRPEARARRVELLSELDTGGLTAQVDPERIQRVLFNLIRNALRHTPSDGSVTVRAEGRPQGVEIEVADTGDGIAPGDRPHVFEPFYRAGADAARDSDGAGLGLAISRAIVETHGGSIWIRPSERGTRVRFSLPR